MHLSVYRSAILHRLVLTLSLGGMATACSGLKLDKSINCLNETSGCFKPDKTSPTYKSTYPEITPAGVAELPYVDLTFSEEMKGGELLENYSLSGPGATNMSLASVTKVGNYTYRIYLNGGVNNGKIRIDYSKLTDYNGNTISNNNFIEYDGNTVMAVAVTAQHNRGGVSNTGGYGTITINFSHNYRSDATNNTSWFIRITPGVVDCTAGVAWHDPGNGLGNNLPPLNTGDLANTQLSRTFLATDFTNPYNAVVICMTNNTNPSAKATGVWYVRRNDTAPTMLYVPPETDFYNSPIAVTLTCTGYPFRIAVTETSQQTSSPPNPPPPAFDANTGLVTTGTSFSTATANVTAQNPANPTRTKFSWQCIDVAGNLSSTVSNTNIEYYVDTNIPAVNVTLDAAYRSFVSATGYTSTTLNFSTDQAAGEDWLIKKGGTNCTTGGTTMYSGTVVAPGQTISQTINVGANATTDFDVTGLYEIRICVHRAINNTWGTAYLQVTRDDTQPTIMSSVTSGSYGAVQHVTLSCTDNADVISHTKAVQLGKVPPTAPGNPPFTTNGSDIVTGPITLDDSSTTIIRYQCRDKAGNFSTIQQLQYTIDATLPNVTVVSTEHTALSNVGGYATSQLVFHATRGGLPYEIRRGVADCTGGPGLGNPNNILIGTTPANLSNISVSLPVASFPTDGTTYDVKICVFNYIDAATYQASTLQITRDDTAPAFTGLTAISAPAVGSFQLSWATVPDAVTYKVYRSTTSLTYGTVADYVTTHPNANLTATGLNPATTYYFIAGAVDAAGNETKVNTLVAQMRSRLNLTVSVTGYVAGAGDFRVEQGGETLAFTTAPGGSQVFPSGFTPGASYAVQVTAQPTNQICSFIPKQFGTITSDVTLNVQCIAGQWVGGRYQSANPAPLDYLLYRGKVTTLAGNGASGFGDNATGTAAQFANPEYLVYLNNALYVADSNNRRIRRIALTAPYAVTTVAGNAAAAAGDASDDNTVCTSARFGVIISIATDGTNLYVSEIAPVKRLRKISDVAGSCSVATFAGAGASGYVDGPAATAQFSDIYNLVSDGSSLYLTETGNHRVRKIDLATGVVSTIAGNGTPASTDAATGSAASFNIPTGLAIIGTDLYVGEICFTCTGTNGNKIRRVSLTAPHAVTTVAGVGGTGGFADGPAATARFFKPIAMVSDGTNLFVADFDNSAIRRLEPKKNYRVSTLAGTGSAGQQDGTGPGAIMNNPHGITTDGRSLYIAEWGGHRIKRVDDAGLVGYWPINPGVSPNDYSSDGSAANNGSVFNGPMGTAADRFGIANLATAFNGVSQFIQVADANQLDVSAEYSISGWINPTAASTNRIVDKTTAGGCDGYMVDLFNNRLRFLYCTTGGTGPADSLTGSAVVPTGQWTHITATFSSSKRRARLYLNGHLDAEYAMTTAALTPTNALPLRLGADSNGSNRFYGAMADIRLYSRALSEGEINELAQNADATVVGKTFSSGGTGLLAHYEFNQGAEDTASGPLGGNLTFTGTKNFVIGKDGDTAGGLHYDGSSYESGGGGTGLPVGTAPRTLCGWLKVASQPAGGVRYPVVSYGTGGLYFDLVYFNAGTTAIPDYRLALTDSGNSREQSAVLPLNTWQHSCITHDGSTTAMYWNGQQIQSSAHTLANVTSTSILNVGKRTTTGAFFRGAIDDVRIYNSALSPVQIRQLATQVPGGLVFRMDSNGDATDVSGFGQTLSSNTGTLASGRQGIGNTAYRFTSGQLATYAHSDTLNAANMTWSFWMRSPDMSAGALNANIIRKFQTFSSDGWVVKYDGTNYLHNYKASPTLLSAHLSLVNNIWTHYTIVRSADGASDQIYINGQVAQNNGGVGANTGNTVAMLIGADGTADITLQDVRIYSRLLNAAEVRALSGYHPGNGLTDIHLHVQADNFSNLSDGAAITTNWQDSTVRNPYNAAGGTAAGNPRFVSGGNSLLGGKPAIEFDSTAGKYFDFGTTSLTYSGLTVCAAATRKGNGYRGLVEKRGSTATNNSWGMLNDLPTNALKFEMDSTASAEVVSAIADDTAAIYCVVSGAGNLLSSYVNGGVSTSTSKNIMTGSNSDRLVVGARFDLASSYYGQIGEVFVSTKDATAAERRIAECYLSAKYSIPMATGIVCP